MKKAVILLSGGLDSATVLEIARSQGYACHVISFDYAQRHKAELLAAKHIAKKSGVVEHKVVDLNLRLFGGSSLTDDKLSVPTGDAIDHSQIPSTYVPARNTIFLSVALGYAEVLGATDIFIGVTAVDYSGYPDCRPEFIAAFEDMANLGTKIGVEGQRIKIHTPLIALSKAEIIALGTQLGVDYQDTVSCYKADAQGQACGICDSCKLRAQGFLEAGLKDVTKYAV